MIPDERRAVASISEERRPGGISEERRPGGISETRRPGGISETRRPGDTYRVVVADDEATMRELMRTVLSLEPDFEVVGQAGDGVEAVAMVIELRPDLVVIDLSMPVMDGLQAIEQIRQMSPATRVAVLSGEPRRLSTGADTYIEKGTATDVLVAMLRALCQGTVAGHGVGAPA